MRPLRPKRVRDTRSTVQLLLRRRGDRSRSVLLSLDAAVVRSYDGCMAPLASPVRSARLAASLLLLTAACTDAPTATLEPAGTGLAALATVVDDPFDRFDASRWVPQAHPLGRGAFALANVVHDPATGALRLVHPAGTLDGGEIASGARYGYGSFEARLRTPRAPGTISAFFLYEGGARSDEIDIEIFNDGSRRIWFTAWIDVRETMHAEYVLPFDPADGFHDYRIEWARGSLRFLVDGTPMYTWSTRKGVPAGTMRLMANAWWPTWIGGGAHDVDHAMEIDRIVVTQ